MPTLYHRQTATEGKSDAQELGSVPCTHAAGRRVDSHVLREANVPLRGMHCDASGVRRAGDVQQPERSRPHGGCA